MPDRSSHQTRLDGTLALPAEICRAEVQTRFAIMAPGGVSRMVFMGAGWLGQLMLHTFEELGIRPLAFADNNPALQGTQVEGFSILSLQDAAVRYADLVLFVPTVYTNGPALAQLEAMGLKTLPLSNVVWQFSNQHNYFHNLSCPESTFGHESRILEALELWSDEASRDEFVGQIHWRRTLDRRALPPHLPMRDIYFPADLLELSNEEVFVDCGAFDGDSLRAFLARVPHGFGAFHGIEADSRNHALLQAFMEGLPAAIASRCKALRVVVGNSATDTVGFSESGSWGSTVHTSEGQAVPAARLDDLFRDTPVTFIKMDVEGSEGDTLEGAREIIRRDRPVLAIVLYHRPEDLWELPLKIKEIYPDYRFFLRRYCDECWEQVCYAIPAERCKQVM